MILIPYVARMTRFALFTVWISLCYLTYFVVCDNSAQFAFIGCNAILEWNLGQRPSKLKGVDVRITNTTADVIVTTLENRCTSRDELSVSCVILQKKEDWVILLLFINITTKHSGNYTAWIKNELEIEIITKQLIVIDKPQIKEIGKPILYESFAVICATTYVSDYLTYHWKINGAYLNSSRHLQANASKLTYTNLTMLDNLSKLVCQVGIEYRINARCNCCSEDSDPYTVLPYSGPLDVDLNPKESDIYLKETQTIKIKCSANCYPVCSFRWEGFVYSATDELVINSFDARMAGNYTCIATNPQTDKTAKSHSVFLHLAKDSIREKNEGHSLSQYWMWPVIACIFPLIVGFLTLVMHWRKAIPRGISCRESVQPCVRQADSELSSKRLNRPLPVPAVQRNLFKMTKRLEYSNEQRTASGLQNFSDQTQSFSNLVRDNLPLQTLFQSTNTNKRQTRNFLNTDDAVETKRGYKRYSWPCSIEESSDVTRQVNLSAKIRRDDKVLNSEQEYLLPTPQENMYSTIDEGDLSLCIDGIDNVIKTVSHETGKSTEHVLYDYADVNLTDDIYRTPVDDRAGAFEICQDEKKDVLVTDHAYLTLMDDSSNPVEICQVEKTDMNGIDQTYITPVNG